MKAIVKTNKSYSTLIIKEDFDVILEENFSDICKAIANRGVALNELNSLFDNSEKIFDEIVRIVRESSDEYQATNYLCVKLGISEPTAKYILALPLNTLTSFNRKSIKKKCEDYKRIVTSMSI